MQKVVLIAVILVLGTLTQCGVHHRADRTTGGKAAYGMATVSSKGKIRKKKKSGRHSFGQKPRKPKLTPEFRKKNPWAG